MKVTIRIDVDRSDRRDVVRGQLVLLQQFFPDAKVEIEIAGVGAGVYDYLQSQGLNVDPVRRYGRETAANG